ncbi:hypothetical protein BC936DRAFT_145295 [Jimgerdemannia flammicorona]|uniref:Uncharacterized protein n=1 Tax=Jimgerdemannia flammicorona TaxID=994334 RepID=A0A433DAE8_9FUNG|nr:hypothetical protein BC936DRAFT_145295 [Jimgerdemannia flammicorona]
MPTTRSAPSSARMPLASSSSVYTFNTPNTSSTSVSTIPESPKAPSFRERAVTPLTPENLNKHTHLVKTAVKRDSVTLTIEKYQESLLSASLDSPVSETFDRPKTDKKKKRRRIQSDHVIRPPRSLPFPYHNDSMFLPIAEHKCTDLSPNFNDSPTPGSLRRARSWNVPRANNAPAIGKTVSMLERTQSTRKPSYSSERVPSAYSRESRPVLRPLIFQKSTKKSTNRQGEPTKSNSSHLLSKMWRFIIGSRKQNKVEPPRVVLMR